MIALQAPAASAPPGTKADWLELTAIRAADRNASVQDLIQAIRRAGSVDAVAQAMGTGSDPDRGATVTESIADDTFAEAENRLGACVAAYPFSIGRQYIQAIRRPERYIYTFLLLLSQFGIYAGPAGIDTASLFESVSGWAAQSYMGGQSRGARHYLFGSPRRGTIRGFRAAIDDLCNRLGEGGGCRMRVHRKNQMDAKLDLVAWRPFMDRRIGQSVAFGQCATGAGWRAKLSELQPQTFCSLWLRDQLAVAPGRFFFVPFRVDVANWEDATFNGGVVFDRCRIASHSLDIPIEIKQECQAWSRHVIQTKLR